MEVQGVTFSGNTQEYKGFHESEEGYRVVQWDIWEYRGELEHRGIHKNTKGT